MTCFHNNIVILNLLELVFAEEAAEKYGRDNLKIYTSEFVNLYFSMCETKQKTYMKLVCLLPEEKVRSDTKIRKLGFV